MKLRTTAIKNRKPFMADEWMAAAEDDIKALQAQNDDLIRRNALLRTRSDVDGDLIAKRVGYLMNLTEALAANANLVGLLRELDARMDWCPICNQNQLGDEGGHTDDCRLAAAIREQETTP